ncbi:MAG: TolC family protein [Myxococcota bacterium]|nr:TolC family protein [Myxococcota bacterium]
MAIALFALLLTATPGATQTPPSPGTAGPNLPSLQGDLALSLADAISMGIENNLDVELVRHDPLIADAQEFAAWGVYDPDAFAEFDYASRAIPQASALQVGVDQLLERELDGTAGIRGLLPKLGWQYQIGYTGSSLETNSAIANLSPEYRANVTATATLPLLRGFWWGEPWVQVKLAGVRSDSAGHQFRQSLMDVVQGIENAYWDLSATKDQLRVADKSLETAEELLEQVEAQYEVGVVSKVEVVEAEAGVASRQFDQIVADNAYGQAEDRLIDLVLGPFLQPSSTLRIIPSDSPEEYQRFEVDPDEATRRALEHRPELAILRDQVRQREFEIKGARNQWLPQLDLRGDWGLNGLSGKGQESAFGGPPPTNISRHYSDAHQDFFTGDQAESWSAGAVFSIPIGNVQARGNLTASRLELRRAKTQVRRQEQTIILEIRDAIRALNSTLEGIEAAESRRVAAAEQLRAESIRLEYGESTPFDVLQREEDLVDAESQKIVALEAYHNSVTALDRAQGTILKDRNILVQEAARLR